MTTVLRVDASPMLARSYSRALGDAFVEAFRARFPDGGLLERDLVRDPLPAIDAATIAAFFAPPDALDERGRAALALSDRLVDELVWSDLLLLTTPIHNFTVPANLKNWIDLIVRHGRTFRYAEGQPPGLLRGKRALVLVAYGLGGYVGVDARPASDQLQPYLRYVLGFIGIHEVEFLGVDGTVFQPEGLSARRMAAQQQIAAYVDRLADQLTR